MYNEELNTVLKDIIGAFLSEQGLDFVDLIYRYESGGLVLRVLVDTLEGGISLGECTRLNRQISIMLDEKDIIKTGYTLEVSSPGLDRLLKNQKDFMRCLGKKIRVLLLEAVEGKMEFIGEVKEAKEGSMLLGIDTGVVEIPFVKIMKAKQIF
ncbi:ribosome maturation factor RimP [bacterium]|nr:MAG: ribosome maturation factor RimP [bacterium]